MKNYTAAQTETRHLSSQLKIDIKELTLVKIKSNMLHQCELFHVYFKLTAQMSGHILSSCILFHQCELFHVYFKLIAQMSCHILSICTVFHQCELFPAYFKLTAQMSCHILSTCTMVKHWC